LFLEDGGIGSIRNRISVVNSRQSGNTAAPIWGYRLPSSLATVTKMQRLLEKQRLPCREPRARDAATEFPQGGQGCREVVEKPFDARAQKKRPPQVGQEPAEARLIGLAPA
jgi:hypothetical protein